MQAQSLSKLGIDETLHYFDLADTLIESINKAKAGDGKIDIPGDLLHFFDVPGKLFTAITGSEQVDDELRDLDEEEAGIIAQRIAKYGPAYANLVKHLMLAAAEVWNIVDSKQGDSAKG